MLENNENPLEDALNIEPTEVRKTTPKVVDADIVRREPVKVDLSKFPDRKKMDQRKDYGEVRENLKDVIDNSKVAIEGILKVAAESDSPRAYEVVSQLLKTATEANKELLDVHKQMKDIEMLQVSSMQDKTRLVTGKYMAGWRTLRPKHLSKYTPHQGKRECARRLKQMQKKG